jgi:ATP-binding protein involved in chromosome partitioning
MSYFICPDCGGRHDIFAHGGARTEAETLGVPFLGEVPLTMAIRATADEGRPIVVSDPASPQAAIYLKIAEQVSDRLAGGLGRPAPRIVID